MLLGASLGAVASLATAFRYPRRLRRAGAEFRLLHPRRGASSRAARTRSSTASPGWCGRCAARRALPDTRAFVSTGELEGLASENRALASFLRERGVDVLFKSAWDGHHWHNWRDQLRDGLRWVLRPEDEEQG